MENTLNWLHISDIHFNAKSRWYDSEIHEDFFEYLNEMFNKSNSEFLRPDFIFCTGDIAFGDTPSFPLVEQYKLAATFFDRLIKVCGVKKNNLFVVPGNHDVNRSKINAHAKAHLVELAKNSRAHINEFNQEFESWTQTYQDAFKRLDEYQNFIKEYLPHQYEEDGRCVYAKCFEVNGLKIGIAGFNSAWSCAGEEDDRNLWLAGNWQFNNAKRKLRQTDIRIGLIHHPSDWLVEAERRDVESLIKKNFDFWLNGHAHEPDLKEFPNCIQIQVAAVSAPKNEEIGFNFVNLKLHDKKNEENRSKAHFFKYDKDWLIHPIAGNAPTGVWHFNLPFPLPKKSEGELGGEKSRRDNFKIVREDNASVATQPFISIIYKLRRPWILLLILIFIMMPTTIGSVVFLNKYFPNGIISTFLKPIPNPPMKLIKGGEYEIKTSAGKINIINVRQFEIGVNEVTVGEWRLCVIYQKCIMPKDFEFDPPDFPIRGISPKEISDYIEWLSNMTGKNYKLPGEIQWMFAATGGIRKKYPWGDDERRKDVAVCAGCSRVGETFPYKISKVSSLPKQHDLHDMVGNVSEIVGDCFRENALDYTNSDVIESAANCKIQVRKGGDFASPLTTIQDRNFIVIEEGKSRTVGFRLALY